MFEHADRYSNGEITHRELQTWLRESADHIASSVFFAAICQDYGSVSGHPGFIDLAGFCSLVETFALMTEEELLHFAFTELQLNQNTPRYVSGHPASLLVKLLL